jgi:hypothetical protein
VEDLENWKIKVSVLWISGYMTSLTTIVLETGSGLKMLDPGLLLPISIISLIGPVMAFLTQILADRANRWANIIMAVVVTVFSAIIVLAEFGVQPALAINPLVGIVFALLVIWYVWKST